MGFFDVIAAALPWSDAEAEAVKGGASTESTPANDTEGGKEEEGDAKVCICCFHTPNSSVWWIAVWRWGNGRCEGSCGIEANEYQHRIHPTMPRKKARIRKREVMMLRKRKKRRRRRRNLLILRRLLRRVSDVFLLKKIGGYGTRARDGRLWSNWGYKATALFY